MSAFVFVFLVKDTSLLCCFQNAQVVDSGTPSAQCPHVPGRQGLEPSEGLFSFLKLKRAALLCFPADSSTGCCEV